jgi:alpha-tubulin suppressor-like RCC1 family protein
VRDGDEADIDCGGSCAAKCADDAHCSSASDCRGGICTAGACTSTLAELAVGVNHACVRFTSGAVKCWGQNVRGELGLGDKSTRGDAAGQMGKALPAVDLGKGRYAKAISCGAGRTCAIMENDHLKCWGANIGPIGPGTNPDRGIYPEQMGDALPELDLGTGRTVKQISAGNDYSCAILDDDSVKCWGNDYSGRLGLGKYVPVDTMGDALPRVDLGTGRTATAITTGFAHTCALLDDASVKCWGANLAGQLGIGSTWSLGDDARQMGDALPAVALGTGRTAKEVRAGLTSTCARLDDGSVKCWGANDYGQLGIGDRINRGDDPSEMGDALPRVDLGTGRRALALVTGAYSDHACAILDDSSTKCWGLNLSGQLGLGDTTNRGDAAAQMGDALAPVALGARRVARTMGTGASHSCALLDDASVKCWGGNDRGQLGLGDTTNRGGSPADLGDALPPLDLTAP